MATPKDHAVLETSIGSLLDDGGFHELDRSLGRFNLFEAVVACAENFAIPTC